MLHKAIQAESLEVMQLLLMLGANQYIDTANASLLNPLTPLQLIVAHGKKDVFMALFSKINVIESDKVKYALSKRKSMNK